MYKKIIDLIKQFFAYNKDSISTANYFAINKANILIEKINSTSISGDNIYACFPTVAQFWMHHVLTYKASESNSLGNAIAVKCDW